MAGRRDFLQRLNPLRCGGGGLPVQAVLVVKLLVIFAVLTKIPGGSHTVAPFIPWLEGIPYPDTIRFLLKLGIAVACLGLFFNIFGRKACLYIGTASLLIILWSRLNFSNNQLYLTLLFLLLGLHVRGDSFWSIRITIGLLYLGAGLNKLLTGDWQTGTFIDYWYTVEAPMAWYDALAHLFGPSLLSILLSWAVILTEFLLACSFLTKWKLRRAIVLGLTFHLVMLFATGGLLSHRFLYLMAASYLLFVKWPQEGAEAIKAGGWMYGLRHLDIDRQYLWIRRPSTGMEFPEGGEVESHSGITAAVKVFIHLPAVWLPAAAIYGLIIFGWP